MSDSAKELNDELERARNQIELAHQEWIAALDAVEDPIFLHDKEFRIVRANRAYQRCAGIPFKEIIGRPYYQVFPKNDGPLPACRRTVEENEKEGNEEEVVVGNRIYRSRAFPVRDEQGEFHYSVHSLEDVTERMEMEASLKSAHDLVYSVVENAPVRIFWKDAGLRYLGCNTAFARDAGFSSPEELVGKDDCQMGWREQADLYRADDKRVMDSGTPKIGFEEPQTLPDGRTVWLRTSKVPMHDAAGKVNGILGIYEDITEWKQAELHLSESEERYRTLFETMLNGFAYCRMLFEDGRPSDFIYLEVNAAFEKQTGLKGVVGKRVSEVIPGILESDSQLIETYGRVASGGKSEQFETYVESMKMWFFISVYCPKPEHFVAVFDVITERKRAEQVLADKEKRFRALIEGAPDGISLLGVDGKIAYASPATQRILGYLPETVIGTDPRDYTHPDDLEPFLILLNDLLQKPGGSFTTQYRFRHQDGSWRWLESTVSNMLAEPAIQAVVFNYRDITERKQALEQIRISQITYEGIINSITETIYIQDENGVFLNVSLAGEKMYGYPREYFVGRTPEFISAPGKNDLAEIAKYVRQAFSGQPQAFEFWGLRKDGTVFPKEISLVSGTYFDKKVVIAVARDITERKQHEVTMQRANRALRTISAGNQALIHANDEAQLLQEMCDVAVRVGGYRMAWLGYARDDAGKTITQMAQACLGTECPILQPLTWDETQHEFCPASRAIISGEPKVVQDIQSDAEAYPWRENARQYGFASCIALPLMDGKRAFGALVLLDDKKNVFDADEVNVLEEMSGDLAFGILTLRVKEAHREHEQRLQKNMLQTVEAIASIVEMRDPYTSGHQARVAELAKEIARQMGLPEEQLHAIHLAGLVHDLGKISIPAEILSKPSRLNEIEYSLIKMHPQAGYDILKGVDFSWPIAQMVLQHHERMDGSGYPRGLKGEEILPGARILIVADVVEAMSSHRPYRPGLGIKAALEEIKRGRGTHYDPQVADACVALFQERGYVLPT